MASVLDSLGSMLGWGGSQSNQGLGAPTGNQNSLSTGITPLAGGDMNSLMSFGSGVPGLGGDAGGTDWGKMLLGGKDQSGLLGLGMDLFGGLASYGMMKDQLKLGEDTLSANTAFANRNIANQAQSINTGLEDRQRARIAGTGDPNSNVYESLGTYLDKNRVDGSAVV